MDLCTRLYIIQPISFPSINTVHHIAPKFREKLHKAKQHFGDLLKDISAEIKHEIHDHIIAKSNVVDANVIEESGAVLKEYQETERLEVEAEASHVPVASQQANILTSRDKDDEVGRKADQDADLHKSLDELKSMEALLLGNENALKEILRDGEESEEEVRRVQEEINFVKALINDLKSLEEEQINAANNPRAPQMPTTQPEACDIKPKLTFLDCFLQPFGLCFLWK